MKWLVIACFLLWARHGEGGALKCVSESKDAPCPLEQTEVEPQDLVADIPAPGPGESLEAECLAGSEWESNCHACLCSEDGAASCCKLDSCDSPITEPIRCKPNTTFERECNTCTCLENGLGLCTLENCQRIPARAPSKENLPMGQDCAPGSEWKSGCSNCVCTPDGLRSCSSAGCPDGQESEPILRCAPHSLWKRECNTCWCTGDGYAMCTKIGCGGIPVDMHFSDEEDESERQEVVESDGISRVPEDADNVEPEETDWNNAIDDSAIERDENNLTGVKLKHLEDFDKNYLETLKSEIKVNNTLEHLDLEEQETSFTIHKHQDVKYDILKNKKQSLDTAEIDKSEVIGDDLKELESSYLNYVRRDTEAKSVNNEIERQENLNGDHNIQDMHHIIKRSVCKPNQDFQSDCNTCKCSATGQSYACTQNECMDKGKEDLDKEVEVFMETEGEDHIERHSVCTPSSTFFVGCNPCQCNADGTDFSCTNKPCPLPEDVEVFHELNAVKSALKPNITKKKVCVENRMFIMDCNTCWCNEDGTSYMCTRRVCIPNLPDEPDVEDTKPEKLRVIKRECRPDEVFELDCNMCRCNPDGKSFSCTRRACVDEDIKDTKNETLSRKVRAAPQEPPKACQPGQEFRMDCNKCLCDNEGQDFSCTRIDCNALNNNNNGGTRRKRETSHKVPADCVPGSVFDQGCNVCRCTDDGGHATCSLKRCPNKEDNKVSTTESSFRCNPGEQFKQSCNDCSCSADGKSVFCTLFICDEDLTP